MVSSSNIEVTINELTQKLDFSQSLHPNSLIFGGLKEKAPIYNFTKRSSFLPHSLERFAPRVSLCRKPRHLDFLLVFAYCIKFVVCLRAPNFVVGVCLKLIVKASDSALKDSNSGR